MSHSHSATPNPNLELNDMVTSLAAHAGVSRDRIELGADVDDLREEYKEREKQTEILTEALERADIRKDADGEPVDATAFKGEIRELVPRGQEWLIENDHDLALLGKLSSRVELSI